jgi:dTDP-4-dehydrorhamnose 3,5-epimerase
MASTFSSWRPATMRVEKTVLPGVVVLHPTIFGDDRGFFLESFNEERFEQVGLPSHFAQDNHSRSSFGVVRGLHYQLRRPQGKLVTVVTGEIFDVAVDIRVGSPTFGRWCGVHLRASEPAFVWIPPGFAHGLAVVSESADVLYKCTTLYDPEDERGLLWNDPDIGIEWPLTEARLSARDLQHPRMRDAGSELPRWPS